MKSLTHLTRRTRTGFTLLELMIVIIIIGVLGAVVGLNLIGAADKAKKDATITSMRAIQQGLKMYHARYSAYPPTNLGFQALLSQNIIQSSFKDGWGNQFDYLCPSPVTNSTYAIISYGSDGREGGEEDIYWTDLDE